MITLASTNLKPFLLQVEDGPQSSIGTNFDGLDAHNKRTTEEEQKGVERPALTKYMQDWKLSQTLSWTYHAYVFAFWIYVPVHCIGLDQRSTEEISYLHDEQSRKASLFGTRVEENI